MTNGPFALLCATALLISACATTASESDPGSGGRRYEPCGGGPVFPPEESDAPSPDGAAAPETQEKESD